MKQTGIWLDKEKAHVVHLTKDGHTLETIMSEVDFFNPSGGSRTRSAKWGPQDVVQDSKYLEREKHQLKKYFNKLVDMLDETDEIALFGPAETKDKFIGELKDNHQLLANKVKAIITSDSMTQNQTIALVKDYFG
ncbi:hypothetical protein ACOCEA_14035 [Maribacter sp. CXY002]|uniref:hypothetical protein n=1 Tax=Maribacter luteocoastalis TaxID=3407671 RepID=UPI003B67316D